MIFPAKSGALTCSGTARVLKGNSKQIGLPGGWDGDFIKPHILVTKNGAAIIPSQWEVTDKGPFRQFLGDISGKFPNVNAAFQGFRISWAESEIRCFLSCQFSKG